MRRRRAGRFKAGYKIPPIEMAGLSETFGDPASVVAPTFGANQEPSLAAIPPIVDRKIILLSTATITNENIHSNGLFQNVFVFYRMFEAMGYAPILIVNERPKQLSAIPEAVRKCRTIVTEDILRRPMSNLLALIEIGMSIDPSVRKFVKMLGARLLKVYLGNILNIDIETPTFIPFHYFAHHVVGRNDQILVSPHYGQHAEYASYLNHVLPPKDLKDMIAPYVWDPSILTRDGTEQISWRRPATSEEEVFVIMEPNISFQKCSLVPLLAMETWYRRVGRAAGWKGRIIVINGERLNMVPHFTANTKGMLEIFRDERVEMLDRSDIVSVTKKYPTATFLLHNYNNEYNYMTLELLWMGFPVLHNSPTWSEYGYFYKGADLAGATAKIQEVHARHSERLEAYRSQAMTLSWRHSPYNAANQNAWRRLLENPPTQ